MTLSSNLAGIKSRTSPCLVSDVTVELSLVATVAEPGQKIGGQGVEFAQVFVEEQLAAFIASLIKQRRGKRCDI